MTSRWLSRCLGVALVYSGTIQAQTSDIQWQVFGAAGAAFQSNPAKVSENETEDTELRAQIGGRLHKDSETLFVDLDYRANHFNWVEDTFDDRSTLEGFGEILWQPKDWFSFYVNNRRTDLIVNNTFVDTQDNRSVRGTTEVGALFTARVSKVDTLNFAPVYRAVFYDSGTGTDSTRPGIFAFWQHLISPTDAFRVNGFYERIDYESSAVQNDVDRAQAFISYAAQLSRLRYVFELGQTWVRGSDDNNAPGVDDDENDFTGTLFRAFLIYDYENHLFELRAFHDLTDTSIGLSDSTVGGIDYNPGDTNLSQLALVTRTQVDVAYSLDFASQRWNWRIGYRYDQQDVEARADEAVDPARDEKRHRANTSLTYNMRRNIDARLSADYYTIIFEDSPIGRQDDFYYLTLNFDFRLFRYGILTAGARHEQRVTNAEPLIGDYTNQTVFVNFKLEFPPIAGGRRSFVGPQGRRFSGGYGF